MTNNGRRLVLATGAGLLLYAARRYFRNWGTTKSESQMNLPGDELIREPMLRITEAVWIERPAAAVWPWLVQMGQDRGGLYGYEFLENSIALHHRNADRVHPEWQHLAPGDLVRLAPRGWLGLRDGLALSVADVIEERAIVLRGTPPSLPWETVWSFHLIPHGDDRCRVLVRTRVGLRHPGEVLLAEAIEPVNALMTRGLLRGIRRRAERAPIGPQQTATPASPSG
ncbi:MAG TPA: SRPBCC family protein [Mycobacterium sp.]|nr:SRPBCC family protein [Mycobacterium sp.]